MENMVNVYFFGKKYTVPADLTIMTAMEYAGYTLKRGCGCRHGFCGACATIYRIKGDNELKTCLACQTQVQEGMYVASIPFFPTPEVVSHNEYFDYEAKYNGASDEITPARISDDLTRFPVCGNRCKK